MSLIFDVHLGGDPQTCTPACAMARARPFQSKLLPASAAKMNPVDLVAVRRAVAEEFATGKTTAEIVRALQMRVSEVQSS